MNPADTRGQDPDREMLRISARRTRRSFLVMAAAAGGGYWLYNRLGNSRQIGMLQWPLRRAEEYNAALFRQIFRERGLAPTYSLSQATDLRLNGDVGLYSDLDLNTWRLKLDGADHAERYRQYSKNMNLWAYLPNEGAAQQPAEQAQAEQPPLDTKELAIEPKGSPKGMLPQQLTGTAVRSNGTGPLQLSETQTITITASAGSRNPERNARPASLHGRPPPAAAPGVGHAIQVHRRLEPDCPLGRRPPG